jgi:WD40 repeat protein
MSGPSKLHPEGTLAVVFTPNSTDGCAVSPDGKWIAGIKDGDSMAVQVWNSKTGQLAVTFAEHTGTVWSVSFSPDSKQILSTSMDKTVRVHTHNL